MGEKATIHIEIDKEKKTISDIRISKHLNPIAASIILMQVASGVLANVKPMPASNIIKPTQKQTEEIKNGDNKH